MSETSQLAPSPREDQPLASEELLPLVYDELRRLAAARLAGEAAGQTLQPTALVHEAWLRLAGPGGRTWQNRAHFFGAAAQAMRRILIENARRKSRIKHGGGRATLDVEELEITAATPDEKLLVIDEALEKFEARDPEKARVVMLKYFCGLTTQEVADSLHRPVRTVERQWTYARAWLIRYIQAQERAEG